jgi:hypothetical protein
MAPELQDSDSRMSVTPDFATLDQDAAFRRIRQLLCSGLADHTVADLVGWHVDDVRRVASLRCTA